jgi:hypothetical protein
MPLSEIRLYCTEHECAIKQTTDEEVHYIILPKQTAVNVAREIIKTYPREALNAIFDDLNEKK